MNKIGFIGCGNMGEAILGGALNSNALDRKNTYVSVKSSDHLNKLKDKYQVNICDNSEVMKECNIIILAVKPYMFDDVIDEIKASYTKDKIIVSIAAGISIDYLKNKFNNPELKVIRVMPNTPSFVNEGMSAICKSDSISNEDYLSVSNIFNAIGKTMEIKEEEMHAIIALSGSSPAYTFMFIDAMIQSGIKMGIDYDRARLLAAQALLGSAKMVLNSDISVDQLKVNVCSPKGTTLEAVQVLEDNKLAKIIDEAMIACANRSKELTK